MEQQILIIIGFLFILPFYSYGILYGATLVKKLIEKDWKKGKGLQKAVTEWSTMTSQDRMDVTLKATEDKTASEWLGSPDPKEEIRKMNEKVYKEGVIHELPQTEIQTQKEVDK